MSKFKQLFYLVFCLLLIMQCKQVDSITASPFTKEIKDGNLVIKYEDQELLSYAIDTRYPSDTIENYDAYKRSGFIHPLKTLSGVTITDGFPHGHTHQHALFSAWTNTTFRGKKVDFWNQLEGLGIVRHKSLDTDGPPHGFSSEIEYLAFMEGDTVLALQEFWDVDIEMRDGYYILDWGINYVGNGQDTLTLNKYHYGGPAFRGSAEWNVPNNYDSLVYFTTDEGLNHIDANHTRPKWASMYGKVGGNTAGVGIIQGKQNLRYPQHIRVHPSMPYYCFIPAVEEPYDIGPNDELNAKFRVVVFDGEVDKIIMEKEMNDLYEKN